MTNGEAVHKPEPQVVWRVVALTALALLARAVMLGHKGLWQDEVFSVLFARPGNAEFWSVLKTAEMNMALYYLVLREWMKFFTSDAAVRALSVIPGVLTVPVVYALGARLYSRRVGMWAAGLLAVNACAVVYSQEARGYSMLVLFTTLSCWAFLRVVERSAGLDWTLYVIFTICAFYCHFYLVFVILAQICALGLLPAGRVPWKGLLASWALIAVGMIPGMRLVLLSHGANLWWLPRPGILEVYRTLTFLAAESGKAVGAVLAVLFLVLIGIAIAAAWKLRGRSEESFRAGFAVMGLLVPMIATMVLSVWRPLFFHRFLIICLVPFLLLAAAGLDEIRNRAWRVSFGVAVLLLSLVATEMSYLKVREDWRGAAGFTLMSPSDPVVFYIKDAAAPFAYYRERLGKPLAEGQAIPLELYPDSIKLAARYPRIWLVHFPDTKTNGPHLIQAMEGGYRLCEQAGFKGMTVSLWARDACPSNP